MSEGIEKLFDEDENKLCEAGIFETSVFINDEELLFCFTDSFNLLLCKLWDLHYQELCPTDFFYNPEISDELKSAMKANNCRLALSVYDESPVVYFYEENQIPFAAHLKDAISELKDEEAIKETFKIEQNVPFTEKLNHYISLFTNNGTNPVSTIYKNTSVGGYGGISRQQFSKIRGKNHISKKNVLLLSIGMRLTVEQTEDLLISDGFCFKDNDPFDAIVKDFIRKRNFDITELDYTLYKHTGLYLSARKSDS